MARNLTLALGTHAYTPLEIASGYAILANGGFMIEPYLIERIEDAAGRILYQANPALACSACEEDKRLTADAPAAHGRHTQDRRGPYARQATVGNGSARQLCRNLHAH